VSGYCYELRAPRELVASPLELDDKPLEPRRLRAQTLFTAISPGTEIAAWSGKPPLRPSKAYPRVVGYCNVARVTELGEDVPGIKAGDHILTHQSHRSHFTCSRDDVLLVLGTTDSVQLRKAATLYLYHLGYVALHEGGYRPGHEVAVIGLGALGYVTAQLAVAFGAEPVILTQGRSLALDSLAGCLFRSKPSSLAALPRWPSPAKLSGPDIVVNTSDGWSDHFLGLALARKGGVVVLLGFPGRDQPAAEGNPLDSQYLYDKQLTIRQVGHVVEGNLDPIDVRFTLARNLAYLWQLMQRGVLSPTLLTTSSYAWHSLGQAYEDLQSRTTGSLSAIVEWSC